MQNFNRINDLRDALVQLTWARSTDPRRSCQQPAAVFHRVSQPLRTGTAAKQFRVLLSWSRDLLIQVLFWPSASHPCNTYGSPAGMPVPIGTPWRVASKLSRIVTGDW